MRGHDNLKCQWSFAKASGSAGLPGCGIALNADAAFLQQ